MKHQADLVCCKAAEAIAARHLFKYEEHRNGIVENVSTPPNFSTDGPAMQFRPSEDTVFLRLGFALRSSVRPIKSTLAMRGIKVIEFADGQDLMITISSYKDMRHLGEILDRALGTGKAVPTPP